MERPGGVFNVSYEKDMAIIRTNWQWVLVISLVVLLFLFPLIGSSRLLNLANTIGITLIAILGLNIVTGYCGQINLGQAAFVAVGGYISAILTTRFGFPFWAALPCAGLGTAVVGLTFGLPAVRVKGFYLVLATLAAQFVVMFFVFLFPDWTGGVDGLYAPPPELGGVRFDTPQKFYFITLVFTIIAILIAKNLVRTRVGRAFIAIRDNDLAAEVMGINLFAYKLLAFFICSFYAGVAGSLFSHYLGFVHPEQYTIADSIWFIGMIIVGGMGSTAGAVFGTVFLRVLEEIVSILGPQIGTALPLLGGQLAAALGLIVEALVIILFLIFEPRGLAHRWDLIKAYYRLWPYAH